MKQEYSMMQYEMDEIIAINKSQGPEIMIGGSLGMSLTERVNDYWDGLGKKYLFDPKTVEQSSRGGNFFLATPVDPPKSALEQRIDSFDTLSKIVEQLKFEHYECQGGPLEMSVAFVALERMAKRGY